MTKAINPTIKVVLISVECAMEVNVDLRPYDRILWHLEEPGDGSLESQVWIAEFYKAGDADGESSLTTSMAGDEKERVVSRWEDLRATIPYYETIDDHRAIRRELYSGPELENG